MVAQKTQQTESPESSAPSAEAQPAHEQIASLAYPLWQHREVIPRVRRKRTGLALNKNCSRDRKREQCLNFATYGQTSGAAVWPDRNIRSSGTAACPVLSI